MRCLLRLLLVRDGQGDRFRKSVSQLSGFACEHLQNKENIWFETMAVDDRALAMQVVNWLFMNWPDNFVAAIRNAQFRHPPNVFSVGDRTIPWLRSAFDYSIHPRGSQTGKRDLRKRFLGSNHQWAHLARAIISE
jgi:hypothetical protein